MNNEKRVVLLSLTILALLLTGFTWAYWNSEEVKGVSINNLETNTIQVGQAESVPVTTTVTIEDIDLIKKPFVPKEHATDNTTSIIEKQINFKWEADSHEHLVNGTVGELRNIRVSIKDYEGKNIDNPYNLFSIEGPEDGLVIPVYLGTNHKDIFRVKVHFNNEPNDQIEYQALQKEGVTIVIDADLIVVSLEN